MPDTSLLDRLIRAADEFPTIDAAVIHRPDLREEHAVELAKVRSVDPNDLMQKVPIGWPHLDELKPGGPHRVLKVLRPVETPSPVVCYRPHSWILVYGWQPGERRPFRLLETFAADAVTLLPKDKENDPLLARWLMHLAARAPEKQVLDWSMLNGKPWFPGWRPARKADKWYAVHLKNVFDLSVKAVRDLMSRMDADNEVLTTAARNALPTLLPVHRAELKIIRDSKQGITAKEIVAKLKKAGFTITESTFRRHHVPILKSHGVLNDGRGYYLPAK